MAFNRSRQLLLPPLILSLLAACGGSHDIESNPIDKSPIIYAVSLVGGTEDNATKVGEGVQEVSVLVTFPDGGSPRAFTLFADIAGDPGDLSTGRFAVPVAESASSVSIPVSLVDDTSVELDENFTVALSSSDEKFEGSSMTYTIVDNDTPYTVTLQDQTASEPDTGTLNVNVEVTIDRAAESELSLDFTEALNGLDRADFVPLPSTTLVIPEGATSAIIPVTVLGDDIDEADGNLTFEFRTASNLKFAGNKRTAKITLLDFEDAPEVSFEVADQTVSERAGSVRVRLVSNLASERVISVMPTATGTASRNRDYTVPTGFASFDIQPGQQATTVDIGIVNDADPEGNETIIFDLAPPNYGTLGTAKRHTLTILGNTGLNDTGVTSKIGTATTHPLQDADVGRDSIAGKAAFAFTKIDYDGNPLVSNAPAGSYACVRDSVTGLTWEAKQRNIDTTTGEEVAFKAATTDPDFDIDADGVADVNTQPAIGGEDWRAWNALYTWYSTSDATNGSVRGTTGEYTGMSVTTAPGPQSNYCGYRPIAESGRVEAARTKYQQCLEAQAAGTPTAPGPASCTMPAIDDGQAIDGRVHAANCNTDSYKSEMVFLNVCGRTGWRTPTIEELRGISSYQDQKQGINFALFMPFAPPGTNMQLWSGDTVPAGTEQGQTYCLDAATGVVLSCAKNVLHSLLMVSE